MATVAVVYFSGYGHTTRLARALVEGVHLTGARPELVQISSEGDIAEEDWNRINGADAIVFGTPTYMGGPAWQFKKFADACSKNWYQRVWLDKLAGGFTNSACLNGDKTCTLQYLSTLAAQHGMIWVSLGLLPANSKEASPADVNYLGAFMGAMAVSPSDASVAESPSTGDLLTAKMYGERIAMLAKKLTNS